MTKGIFYFLLFTTLTSCDYYLINPHKHHVGVITDKSFFENDDFEVCYEEKIFPYYYGRNPAGYGSTRDTLKQFVLESFDNQGFTNTTGYITVRFIINCKGKIGRFKIDQVGLDFKQKQFNKYITNHLLAIIKNIDNWDAIEFKNNSYDSFYHITFKLINGDLVEVLA